jgi:hypothetical protein
MPETKRIRLVVIDGEPACSVMMVSPPVHPSGACRDDRHCAAHGEGPYVCCRCGAQFLEAAVAAVNARLGTPRRS